MTARQNANKKRFEFGILDGYSTVYTVCMNKSGVLFTTCGYRDLIGAPEMFTVLLDPLAGNEPEVSSILVDEVLHKNFNQNLYEVCQGENQNSWGISPKTVIAADTKLFVAEAKEWYSVEKLYRVCSRVNVVCAAFKSKSFSMYQEDVTIRKLNETSHFYMTRAIVNSYSSSLRMGMVTGTGLFFQ